MEVLKIEWKHLDVSGETCLRCSDTGETLAQVVEALTKLLESKGIIVEFVETKLDDTQIPQSNAILFNDIPIEEVLDIEVSKNYCESCTTLLGRNTYCRTVTYEGTVFEDIPTKAIRQAALMTLGLPDEQENQQNSGSCSCSPGCCSTNDREATVAKRHITIDFMYLDLSVCSRCQGTNGILDAALAETSGVLRAAGVEVTVNKILIATEEQARQLRFASSPTIRVNGRDIQMEVRESLCESCGDLCGDDVDCRVWVYQEKEYTVPPKAMIIDAILREVYGNAGVAVDVGEFEVPDNLKRFFQSMQQRN